MTRQPVDSGGAPHPVVSATELEPLRGSTILVTGAHGMLGSAFVEALQPLGDAVRVHAFGHRELDVTNKRAVSDAATLRPTIILHCAGMALADQCEREPAQARAVHAGGTQHIATLALTTGARVFYPQSVFIFDGRELPVTEATTPAPGLVYGRVKLEAEAHLLQHVPRTLSVRMAGFFGGEARDKNFIGKFVRGLQEMRERGERRVEVGDRIWQPTYTLDLARNALLLLAEERTGIYHMGAIGEATFFEVAHVCVEALGLAGDVDVSPCASTPFDDAEPARRPARMVTANRRLDAEGLLRQRAWDVALREYLARPYFDFARGRATR